MGRFRIEERIGSGGMGTVYRAFDERLERTVAVKEIECAGADRILREAQAAARLNHPAIVTLYELGERDGHAILVSELVDGQTLDRLVHEGSISDRDVAQIGADLCAALQHAHKRGVVHRDVKPQNAIVRPWESDRRRAKLMDFGIAAVAGAPALTATGEVVGPEADVYSLALTLYEAWAGENPVSRRSPAQTARQIGQAVPSLALARPDLPEAVVAQIDACLEADPRSRPALARLRTVLDRHGPELDDDCAVPAPDDAEAVFRERSFPQILALSAIGIALATLAGPAGMPGAALVCAVLLAPALATTTHPLLAALPLAAIPLGAIGCIGASAALVAVAARRPIERFVLGAAAFATYMAAAVALDTGSRLGLARPAPGGWESSVAGSATDVLAALGEPVVLLGMLALGLAATVLGWVLRAHPALALVGAMIWSAGVGSALTALGNGAQGKQAGILVLAAGLAVGARARTTRHQPPVAPPPQAPAQPALHH